MQWFLSIFPVKKWRIIWGLYWSCLDKPIKKHTHTSYYWLSPYCFSLHTHDSWSIWSPWKWFSRMSQSLTWWFSLIRKLQKDGKAWKSHLYSSITIWVGLGFSIFFGGGCYTVTRSTMAGPIDPMANLHGLGRRFGRPSGESGPRPSRSPGCWRCAGRTASSLGTSSPEIHGFLTSFDQLGETSEPENPWLIWHIDHPNWMASPQTFPNQIQWNSTWGPFRWIGFLGKSWVCTCRFSPTQSCDCCLLWRIKVIQLQYRGTWCHQPHFQK